MKKAFIPIFLAFVLLSGNVGIVDAATLTQSQISAIIGLLRSFGADEGTIANVNSALIGTGTSVPSSTLPVPSSSAITYCPTLRNTLYRGSSDSWTKGEVSMLQRFLRQLYPELPVTGYFGVLTEEAVIRFQTQYGISAVGIVGPETSKKIASLCEPVGYPIDPLPPVSAGYLQIEPSSASIGVGGSVSMKAIFQPPMPQCPEGAYCAQVMPASIPVVAEWTSSNPGVASILVMEINCSGACPIIVKGNSNGTADIKAAYKSPSGSILTATARVTVGSVSSVPSITVLSPNGGEQFQLGSTQPITWSVGSFGRTYRISIVDKNGFGQGDVATVTGTAADKQVYYWNVGQVKVASDRGDLRQTLSAGEYKILIHEVETGSSDYSNAPFSIVAGTSSVSEQIKCVFNNSTTEQQCYSTDGQYKFSGIGTAGGVVTGTSGTQITWKSSCGGYAYTTIDGNNEYANFYCSTTQPSITVLSPNGGEKLEIGKFYTLSFAVKNAPAGSWVALTLQQNGVQLGYLTIGADPNTQNSISWGIDNYVSCCLGGPVVPIPPGDGYKVQALLYTGTKPTYPQGFVTNQQFYVSDTSDSPFSIVAAGAAVPTLNVSLDASTPSSATLIPGQTSVKFAQIKATAGSSPVNNLNGIQIGSDSSNASAFLTNVRVFDGVTQIGGSIAELAWGGGYYQNWVMVGGVSIPANTSKVFTVVADVKPTAPAGSVRLGIAGWNFNAPGANVVPFGTPIYGNAMTIAAVATQPPVTVISPNGGEVWQKGTPVTIKWNYDGNYGERSVRIDLLDASPSYGSTPNPSWLIANYIPINSNNSGPANSGSYTWTIPTAVLVGSNYKIRIAISGTEGYGDSSDSTFQIVNNVALATPVFTKLSVPTNTLTNGTQVLYRFRATTISSQDASISSLQFPISLTGVAPISLSNISLYGYSDSGFSVQAYSANPVGQQYGSIGSTVVVFSQGDFPLDVPLAIPAGTSRYFEVKGVVNIGSFAPVSVTTSLSGLGSETLTTPAPSASPSPVGYVGPVSSTAINGWACVPGLGNQLKVSISITPGNYQISNITANVPRTEAGFLQNSGCTDINHGFAVNPSLNFPSLPAGSYTVSATAQHPTTGAVVSLTPLSGQTTFTVGAAVEPAPSLSSVTPNTVIAFQTTTFVIIGDYFQPGAIVVYSGPSSGTLSTTFYSKSELRVAVPGGLLQGTYTFKVLNPPPYGKESGTLSVTATAPTAPSGAIISMTPNPCTVATGATRCPVTIMWSAFNAPSAGIRARDSVSGWEGLVCAADKTLCTLDAAPGNYAVKLHLVATDPNSQILDQKSGVINPPSTSTGGATSGADLVALSISPSGPFTVGQSVTFSAVVKNAGGGAMPGSGYDADLMIDYGNDNSTCQGPGSTSSSGCNAYIGSPLSVPLIAPAATHTFGIPWTATCQTYTAPCTHLLRFRVDLPYNLMPESSESNNYITKLITVYPVGVGDASSGGDIGSLAALLFSLERQLEELERLLNSLLP